MARQHHFARPLGLPHPGENGEEMWDPIDPYLCVGSASPRSPGSTKDGSITTAER
jgi:hypothetical protein